MEKFLLTVSCCFVLTEAHNITIDNINKSIIFHKTSIEQKMRCISDETIKTKYTNELQNGKSLQISRLIALTKHGLPSDSSLDSLQINDTKSKTNKLNLQNYSQLINANSIDDLIRVIGSETIKNWNTNEESGKSKLNTFFGFACATNARVNKKTFSQQDRHKVIDETFIKIWDSTQTHLKTKIKRNLDIAFDSWEVHCLDYLFGDKKTHTVGISNGSGYECFNNTAQQNLMCLPELHPIIKGIASNTEALSEEVKTRPQRMVEHIRKGKGLDTFPNAPRHVVTHYKVILSDTRAKTMFDAFAKCIDINSSHKLDIAVNYCWDTAQLPSMSAEQEATLQKTKREYPWVEQIYKNVCTLFSDETCRQIYTNDVRNLLWDLFPSSDLINNRYKNSNEYLHLITAEHRMIEQYKNQKEGSCITTSSKTTGSLSRNILKNVQFPTDTCTMADAGQNCSKFLFNTVLDSIFAYSVDLCPNYVDKLVELFSFTTENPKMMRNYQSSRQTYTCQFDTCQSSPSSANHIYNTQAGIQDSCDNSLKNRQDIHDAVPPKYLCIDTCFGFSLFTEEERILYGDLMKELSNLNPEELAKKRIVNYVLSLNVPTNKRYKYIFRSAGCKSGNTQGGHWITVKRNVASFEYISDSYVNKNYSIENASSELAKRAMYVIYERLDDATIEPIK